MHFPRLKFEVFWDTVTSNSSLYIVVSCRILG